MNHANANNVHLRKIARQIWRRKNNGFPQMPLNAELFLIFFQDVMSHIFRNSLMLLMYALNGAQIVDISLLLRVGFHKMIHNDIHILHAITLTSQRPRMHI